MNKYISYIIAGITIIGFLFGGITSYNKLEAKTEKNEEKVVRVEAKIGEMEKDNKITEKSLTEFSVEQKYIKKSVDELNENLKDLIKELKK